MALIGAAALSSSPAAAARSATIQGRLAGLPGPAGATAVRAIDVRTGSVADGSRGMGALRYRVAVPAGFYLLAAEAVPEGTRQLFSGKTRGLRIRGGQRRTLHVRLRAADGNGASTGSHHRPYVAARRPVVSVEPIPVDDATPTGIGVMRFGPLVITDLVNSCVGDRFDVTSPDDRELAAAEAKRQRDRAFDPRTRVRFRPPRITHRVTGSASVTPSGELTVSVRLIERATGDVVASATGTADGAAWFDAYRELMRRLTERICQQPVLSLSVEQQTTWSDFERETGADSGCVRTMSGSGSQTVRLESVRLSRSVRGMSASFFPPAAFPNDVGGAVGVIGERTRDGSREYGDTCGEPDPPDDRSGCGAEGLPREAGSDARFVFVYRAGELWMGGEPGFSLEPCPWTRDAAVAGSATDPPVFTEHGEAASPDASSFEPERGEIIPSSGALSGRALAQFRRRDRDSITLSGGTTFQGVSNCATEEAPCRGGNYSFEYRATTTVTWTLTLRHAQTGRR